MREISAIRRSPIVFRYGMDIAAGDGRGQGCALRAVVFIAEQEFRARRRINSGGLGNKRGDSASLDPTVKSDISFFLSFFDFTAPFPPSSKAIVDWFIRRPIPFSRTFDVAPVYFESLVWITEGAMPDKQSLAFSAIGDSKSISENALGAPPHIKIFPNGANIWLTLMLFFTFGLHHATSRKRPVYLAFWPNGPKNLQRIA